MRGREGERGGERQSHRALQSRQDGRLRVSAENTPLQGRLGPRNQRAPHRTAKTKTPTNCQILRSRNRRDVRLMI